MTRTCVAARMVPEAYICCILFVWIPVVIVNVRRRRRTLSYAFIFVVVARVLFAVIIACQVITLVVARDSFMWVSPYDFFLVRGCLSAEGAAGRSVTTSAPGFASLTPPPRGALNR